MASYSPFNKTTLSFNGGTFNITSFSMEGGSRAEIDITNSTDVRRKVIPGMASPRMLNFGFNYNGEMGALTQSLNECTSDALDLGIAVMCGDAASALDVKAFLMSFDISGDLDGIITGSLTFMVSENESS